MSRKIFIFVLAITLGIRFVFFYQGREVYKDKQQITFSATLLSEPKFISSRQSLSANLPNGEKVFITTTVDTSLNYGDNISISGTLNKRLIKDNKAIWTMLYPQIIIQSNSLGILSLLRENIISLFHKTLPAPSSSLLLGIVFGIKEQMDKTFLDQLRNVGVLHVIAASGMNVVMVGGFLSSLFSYFLKRQWALVFSIFGIFFYALLAGFEPSIIRASIMGGLVFVSQILGRQNAASHALFLTAFLMLFISPSIISDIGFQLSFTATAGLLYIRPLFDPTAGSGLKSFVKKSVIGEDILTTIAAQLATLPILLANFGIYSFWSVMVNALVLWTVPPLMILGGLGAVLGLILNPLGQIFLYLCLPLLYYFEKIVSVFGSSGGVLNLASLPWQIIVGYYSLLACVILVFKRK